MNQEDPSTRASHKSLYTRALPHVRESTKVLDSRSRPLDSSFLDSGIHTIVNSGFHTIVDSGLQTIDSRFQSSGFQIPTAKKLLDSGFSYMGQRACVFPVQGTHTFSCAYACIVHVNQPITFKLSHNVNEHDGLWHSMTAQVYTYSTYILYIKKQHFTSESEGFAGKT